jgi:hypothetical protein
MASGISNTARITGLAMGVAVLGAVLEQRIGDHLAAAGYHGNALASAVSSSGLRAAVGDPALTQVADDAFVSGLRLVLLTGFACREGAVGCERSVAGSRVASALPSLGGCLCLSRSSRSRASPRQSPQRQGRKALLLLGIPAYPRSSRKRHDRPVTPEVAGSSPVAAVFRLPCKSDSSGCLVRQARRDLGQQTGSSLR